MTQLLRRFVLHPVVHVSLLATLLSVLVLAGLGALLVSSSATQRMLAWLDPRPHLSHPLGQLRGNAPVPSASSPSGLASAPSVD